MKKTLFLFLLVTATSFAINPKNINPVKEKLEIERVLINSTPSDNNVVNKRVAIKWKITCRSGSHRYVGITTNTFNEAAAYAENFCGGNDNWYIMGDN